LGTLIRHAGGAAGAVIAHGIAVVEPALLTGLMAGAGGALRDPPRQAAAGAGAVAVAAVAAAAQEEDLLALWSSTDDESQRLQRRSLLRDHRELAETAVVCDEGEADGGPESACAA
jgi:hypothetical protein